jgi:regulator of protease activity HflC (stomatin/prohibitin superfamily)
MGHALDILAGIIWSGLGLYTAAMILRSVRMVPNKTELIVERLGRYHETLGPGFHVLLPFVDRVAFTQDMKEEAIEVPPQECFTRDNVQVEVDGIVYMSVVNAKLASYGVTDYRFAAIQLAQTTTRSIVGTLDLDRTFEERDHINSMVIAALNEVSAGWGIKVHRYEVKNIVPPASVREAMERQMGAERDRRALLARSEGEKQARINDSEGKKQEMINRSQGELQRRVNEAEGRAEEILAIARATADSLLKMSSAISIPGGAEAVNLRLSQQLIGKLGHLSNGANVVLPMDLTRVDDVLAGMGLDPAQARSVDATVARAAERPALPARETVPVPVPPAAPEAVAARTRPLELSATRMPDPE